MTQLLWLLVAALVVFAVVRMSFVEKFQPEFLDKRQVDRTVATEYSSYAQRTNHLEPAHYNMGAIVGTPSVFQVNQWPAYIP